MDNNAYVLHASLIAGNVKPEDEVIVPALTFFATANVVKYCGVESVLIGCDYDTLCIDVEKRKNFYGNFEIYN